MIRVNFQKIKTNKHGQSFVELMLILLVLALILAGVVEFGFLMNNYLHVLDGAREAARYSANSVAIADDGTSIMSFYENTAIQAENVMPVSPTQMDGAATATAPPILQLPRSWLSWMCWLHHRASCLSKSSTTTRRCWNCLSSPIFLIPFRFTPIR
ncbi:MAG: pilus assembly protein [Chloroflexi bacterium]|nr:pilus assembly protein [Chloroflexota bacterium]